MKSTDTLQQKKTGAPKGQPQRSYSEIIEFLDANWKTNSNDTSLQALTQLDQALDTPSKKLSTIFVGGTNGKSLTISFTKQLLQEEKLSVGALIAPHTLTYNERFILNNETISNKLFAEIGNHVINTASSLSLALNSIEILTIMALVYFEKNGADVAILETQDTNYLPKAAGLCSPSVVGITRITEGGIASQNKATEEKVKQVLELVKPQAHVVSADQSKLNLQTMQKVTESMGATWSMPIRKLAPLAYPFEQLHGRCAALAERIATIFINEFVNQSNDTSTDSLLIKTKGQRGRPTLEAKRRSEMNPKKTLEQFWKDVDMQSPGRFQLLSKEKPTVLLDNAQNIDALSNLLLGIRLLHYQRPLKGLSLIIGNNDPNLDTAELVKLLRYFFKKTSGQIIICPAQPASHNVSGSSWNSEELANQLKTLKIKARTVQTFKEAFEHAIANVDERHGLVVVTGSQEMISEYWRNKGIKKI